MYSLPDRHSPFSVFVLVRPYVSENKKLLMDNF